MRKGLFFIVFSLILVGAVSCDKSNEPVMREGHEVVDLGLPSGTLWATCNIGAEIPEAYGTYFCWGETKGKNEYDSYKFYDFEGNYIITKYCTDSIDRWGGAIDNLIILESQDDAATMNWGEDFRMPTREELQELIDYCAWEWTTQNGVAGYRVVSKHDASIFLPAAGYRSGTYFYDTGTEGIYWSSSLCTYRNTAAFGLRLDEIKYDVVDDTFREVGYSVRAVYSPKK